jgi:pyridoxal phosphate enzyme (YggS family)
MVLDSPAIASNVARARERLASACERVGRDPGNVRIVAAGKTVPLDGLRAARVAGIEDFGENYVQELRDKRDGLPGVRWHFIGTLQSRTAPRVADLADVVQTLAPGRASERLARRAARRRAPLDALIEVDFAGRGSGVGEDACERFADEVAGMPGIRLVGLMTLPPVTESAEEARPYFARLRSVRDRVAASHPDATELSMGMSLDYEVAAEEGATIVRIGTALFGARPPVQGRVDEQG